MSYYLMLSFSLWSMFWKNVDILLGLLFSWYFCHVINVVITVLMIHLNSLTFNTACLY